MNSAKVVEEVIKHLPGKHDQKAHGKAGGKIAFSDMTDDPYVGKFVKDPKSKEGYRIEPVKRTTVESMVSAGVKPAYSIKVGIYKYDIWKANEGRVSNLGPWVVTGVYRRTNMQTGENYDSEWGYDIGRHNSPFERDPELQNAYWQAIRDSLSDVDAIIEHLRK